MPLMVGCPKVGALPCARTDGARNNQKLVVASLIRGFMNSSCCFASEGRIRRAVLAASVRTRTSPRTFPSLGEHATAADSYAFQPGAPGAGRPVVRPSAHQRGAPRVERPAGD